MTKSTTIITTVFTFVLSTTTTLNIANAFVLKPITHQLVKPLLQSTSNNNEIIPGIVEKNVPQGPKSKKQSINNLPSSPPNNVSNMMDIKRRQPRFEYPPERESGYYSGSYHVLPDGHRLIFDEYYLSENESDLVVCLNNLADTRENDKASSVLEYCRKKNSNYLSFDWFGRGKSSGKLMEATISRWSDDTIHFLENQASHVKGGIAGVKAVLVGVGVGGWIAILVALRRPDLVRGIVGLAADPDFTEDLLWAKLPKDIKDGIMKDGFREVKWGNREEVYPITSTLIEDGRKNLVLRGGKDSLEILCPVRLIHSLEDEEVPYTVPLKLAEAITTENIRVIMPKVGGHDLSNDYRPAGPGWVDPEDTTQSSFSSMKQAKSQRNIKGSLEDCLDQVFFSTMEVDASDTW